LIYINEINKNAPENVCKLVVANKADKEQHLHQVSRQQMEDLSNQYQIPFVETSAKNTQHVNQMFEQLTRQILQNKHIQHTPNIGNILISNNGQNNTNTNNSSDAQIIRVHSKQKTTTPSNCWC